MSIHSRHPSPLPHRHRLLTHGNNTLSFHDFRIPDFYHFTPLPIHTTPHPPFPSSCDHSQVCLFTSTISPHSLTDRSVRFYIQSFTFLKKKNYAKCVERCDFVFNFSWIHAGVWLRVVQFCSICFCFLNWVSFRGCWF